MQLTSQNNTGLHLYHSFKQISASPTALQFKLKRGYDQSLNLYFGNGEWGKEYLKSEDYQIVWLDASTTSFNYTKLSFYQSNLEINPSVVSSSNGSSDDIEYVRTQYKSALAKNSVVAVEDQIKAFVKSFSQVVDCNLKLKDTNHIQVYIKPKNISDSVFDYINYNLSLYGEIVTKWSVDAGNPLYFNISLRSLDSISESIRLAVRLAIADSFYYQSLPYRASISTLTISDIVKSVTDARVEATLSIKESYAEVTDSILLPTRPHRGSISIKSNGVEIGWDRESYIYGSLSKVPVAFTNIIPIGDLFITLDISNVRSFNSEFNLSSSNTERFPIGDMTSYVNTGKRLLIANGTIS